MWHKPNSVPAFARGDHLSHSVSQAPSTTQPHFQIRQKTCPGLTARSESGAGWRRMRLIPEGFFPHSRENGRATLPSALSCTTWGFSCGSAYAKARWALTPPFQPYPAPPLRHFDSSACSVYQRRKGSAGRYIFCDTFRRLGLALLVARAFARRAAYRCSDFPLPQIVLRAAIACHNQNYICTACCCNRRQPGGGIRRSNVACSHRSFALAG